MRVLVTGSRKSENWQKVYEELDRIHATTPITLIIEGGARGIDAFAANWAAINSLPCETFDADWLNLGTSAGPIRNSRMLKEGKPDLVVAFPGGKGTQDMVRKSIKAGVEVIQVLPDRTSIPADARAIAEYYDFGGSDY